MEKAKILVLIGQSNAVGVGHTKYLSKHFDEQTVKTFYEGYENVLINFSSHYILSNGFTKTRVNCTEKEKDTLGPEVGIAKYLTERHPDQKFFIVKCAFGGTNLFNDWTSPSSGKPYSYSSCVAKKDCVFNGGWCYNEFIKIMKESILMLEKNGYVPEICGIFWMQGESDACKDNFKDYRRRYDNLLKDINAEFAKYMQNCTYVDAGISSIWKYYKEINAIKKEYAKEHGYRYVDTIANNLTTTNEPEDNPDVAHYDSDSIVKLGELFAKNVEF